MKPLISLILSWNGLKSEESDLFDRLSASTKDQLLRELKCFLKLFTELKAPLRLTCKPPLFKQSSGMLSKPLCLQTDSTVRFTGSIDPFKDPLSFLWITDESTILTLGCSFLMESASSEIFALTRFGLSSFKLFVPTCTITSSGLQFTSGEV